MCLSVFMCVLMTYIDGIRGATKRRQIKKSSHALCSAAPLDFMQPTPRATL